MTYVIGDCIDSLRALPADSVDCCITSPPYWCLRDYGGPATRWPEVSYEPMPGLGTITVAEQIEALGQEPDVIAYIGHLIAVFREVRRVLRPSGTCWVNLGDSWIGAPGGGQGKNGARASRTFTARIDKAKRAKGLVPKSLAGIPWRFAFAAQADGWLLRSEIVWAKPNPMPESVADRPTKAHEQVFLLVKQPDYYYHEPGEPGSGDTRRARSVWTIPSEPYNGAHFAVMPTELVARCMMRGCPEGGMVIDPFLGSGTVGAVAQRLGRRWWGCESQPDYEQLIRERTRQLGLV